MKKEISNTEKWIKKEEELVNSFYESVKSADRYEGEVHMKEEEAEFVFFQKHGTPCMNEFSLSLSYEEAMTISPEDFLWRLIYTPLWIGIDGRKSVYLYHERKWDAKTQKWDVIPGITYLSNISILYEELGDAYYALLEDAISMEWANPEEEALNGGGVYFAHTEPKSAIYKRS